MRLLSRLTLLPVLALALSVPESSAEEPKNPNEESRVQAAQMLQVEEPIPVLDIKQVYTKALGLEGLIGSNGLQILTIDDNRVTEFGNRVFAILPNGYLLSMRKQGEHGFNPHSIENGVPFDTSSITAQQLRTAIEDEIISKARTVLIKTKGGVKSGLVKDSAVFDMEGTYYIATNSKGLKSLYFIEADTELLHKLVSADDPKNWIENEGRIAIEYQLPDETTTRQFTYQPRSNPNEIDNVTLYQKNPNGEGMIVNPLGSLPVFSPGSREVAMRYSV